MFRVLGIYNFGCSTIFVKRPRTTVSGTISLFHKKGYQKVAHVKKIKKCKKHFVYLIRVLLLRQIWIVKYQVKYSSDNLSNENKNTGFQRNYISKIVETFFLDYWEKTRTENQQLLDRIIDITLFDGVEGPNFINCVLTEKRTYVCKQIYIPYILMVLLSTLLNKLSSLPLLDL